MPSATCTQNDRIRSMLLATLIMSAVITLSSMWTLHETYIPTSDALDTFFYLNKEDITGDVTDGSSTNPHDVNAVHGTGILVAPDTNTKQKEKSEDSSLTQLQTKARMLLANKTNSLPPDSLGAFIHIGKTGGSTLSILLKNGCHSWLPKPCQYRYTFEKTLRLESALSNLTTYYHTPDFVNKVMFQNLEAGKHEFIVITVRDPLERMISNYQSGHPENGIRRAFSAFKNTENFRRKKIELGSEAAVRKFRKEKFRAKKKELVDVFKCFPTLDAFAMLLDDAQDYNLEHWVDSLKRGDCANVAKLAINQIDGFDKIAHFRWGLMTMQNLAATDKYPTMAIRTEYLNDDWVSANKYLGQESDVILPSIALRNSTLHKTPVEKDLSEDGKKKLCMALKEEYASYLSIIQNAINLKQHEKLESLEYSREKCPWLKLSFKISAN